MDRWVSIRRLAAREVEDYERRAGHAAFDETSGSHRHLSDLANRLYRLTVAPDSDLPEGTSGRLNLDEGTICYRPTEDEARQRFTVAHEIGHHVLRHPPRTDPEPEGDIDDEPNPDGLTVRDNVYRAYSEHDRYELEANLFAAELLAPVERVRARVLADRDWTVDGLAVYFGVSRAAMRNQLAAALLPGPTVGPEPPASGLGPGLDGKQWDAARAPSPALVLAGPGAGKTRVLVARFEWLVHERGARPERILALTFANKAAEEMRERIAARLPDAAHAIQVWTFHGLGYELLKGYAGHLGIEGEPRLLTQIAAAVFLRQRLGELPLGPFEDLHRPTRHLKALLDAISRAKDDLRTPHDFAAAASEQRRLLEHRRRELESRRPPVTDAEREELRAFTEDVAKWEAAADVYAVYQQWLREAGRLDFGDLIVESVRLLGLPGVGDDIRGRYDHILVDEFQDINYASGQLVKDLDGGRGVVWAVGDPRQAIYGFRGASPLNLLNFKRDYPGAQVISLDVNYRSLEDIVQAGQAVRIPGSTAAAAAEADGEREEALPVPALRSDRGRALGGPAIEFLVAPSGNDELGAVVARVEEAAKTLPLGAIAVLCRTRSHAQDVADALEARRIPTDWGGAVENRAAFKDASGVLLFASDDPRGLIRLSRLDEHRLAEADLRLLLTASRVRRGSVWAALRAAQDGEVEGLTEAGREQVERLAALQGHLRYLPTAWQVLSAYFFERAAWPRALFGADELGAQRYLATLGQVATLAREFAEAAAPDEPRDAAAFVGFLASSLESGALGAPEEAPLAGDAVHVLTAHRSKGLEWPLVLVPNLVQGRFPPTAPHEPLPIPPGLLRGGDGDGEREEAHLFYVAVTRARDQLVLSRADRYPHPRGAVREPPFLAGFVGALVEAGFLRVSAAPALEALPAETPPAAAPWPIEGEIRQGMLETYDDCPRRAMYEYVYGLRDGDREYPAFQNLVYGVLAWAAERAAAGAPPTPEETDAEVATRWDATGLGEHWYGPVYRRKAEAAVRAIVVRLRPGARVMFRRRVSVRVGERTLSVLVDEIEETDAGYEWRQHHLGPPAASHAQTDRLAMFVTAHKQLHADSPQRIWSYYPLHGGDAAPQVTKRIVGNREAKMAKLAQQIEAGEFPPRPSPYRCATCPFVLICPA